MKVKGQKLKICAKKARAANKRRVAFFPKIATRWIYFIHIFRQLLVPNLSKSEKKSSVLALVPYYTDYGHKTPVLKVVLCTCFTDPRFIAFIHFGPFYMFVRFAVHLYICYFVKVSNHGVESKSQNTC